MNKEGRPRRYPNDPIMRMRAYVRKSIKESIEFAALHQHKTTGQIIDEQFADGIKRPANQADKGPKNKKTELPAEEDFEQF